MRNKVTRGYDIDNIESIHTLRNLCKRKMIQLKKDIETPHAIIYPAGYWYFFIQEDDGSLFIYDKDLTVGVVIEENEIQDFIEWD